jgi:hypothetical protein
MGTAAVEDATVVEIGDEIAEEAQPLHSCYYAQIPAQWEYAGQEELRRYYAQLLTPEERRPDQWRITKE